VVASSGCIVCRISFSTFGHNCPILQSRGVSAIAELLVRINVRIRAQAAGGEINERTEACRRLYIVETRYSEEMTDGIIEFVRPLSRAVLSQSDKNTLFQNVEKVHIITITLHSTLARET